MAGNAESIIYQVLDEISEAESADVLELPSLEEAIDVDALITLVASAENIRIEFEYAGYDVHITNETVSIQPR